MQIAHVRMHQRPTRTDIARPRNRHGAVLNEVTYIVGAAPVSTCKANIQATVEYFKKRFTGGLVKIHFGQAEMWKMRSL